jgi:hypothetical protein
MATDADDILALCDVIEDYKVEFASLSKELTATRKALERADEQAAATAQLVAELEDAIYCLDDDVASKHALLEHVVSLLDADSPAADIVDGLRTVIAAYEAGSALDDVLVTPKGDTTLQKQLRAAEARFEAELADKEDEVARAHGRVEALTRANQDLKDECRDLAERLRAAEEGLKRGAAVPKRTRGDGGGDDDDDDEAKEEPSRVPTFNPRVPPPLSRHPFGNTSGKSDSDSKNDSPVREPPARSRGTVVLQAIRKARARSIAVAAAATDEQEVNEDTALEALTSPGRYGAPSSVGHRGSTHTATNTVKAPPLSFSHPKFKRGDPHADAAVDDCAIHPDDLRHSSRSFSVFGTMGNAPQRRLMGNARGGGDRRRPSSSGTQGKTDEEDDDDDDDH